MHHNLIQHSIAHTRKEVKMDVKKILTFLHFSAILGLTSSFLDLEELQSIQYGIDIVSTPVVMGDVSAKLMFY